MTGKINVLLIDDEKRSLATLNKLIEKYCPTITVLGMAGNVKNGIELIDEMKPDLVFLDITMPDGDGFNVLEKVSYREFEVIFTTASDRHAVKAFEFSAIHYLLKPIDFRELQQAVERFEKVSDENTFINKMDVLRKSLNNEHQKIILPSSDGLNIIELDEVIRCEASKNYTIFYLKDGQHMIASKPLNKFENILTDINFVRVHSKHLINLQYVKKYEKGKGGFVIFHDGSNAEVSEGKKKYFIQKLKEYAKSL